jgi:SAM-dependent methyltransferase
MIDHDNLADYADPYLYDMENPDEEPVGSFLLELAQQANGPILELGCGTGRYTLYLTRLGFTVTGVDIVPGMLARARQKAGDLPVDWVEADVRCFQLPGKFAMIFEIGAMFQHLLTRPDQEAFLAGVRDHLAEDGRFLISALFTKPPYMVSSDEEEDWFEYDGGDGRVIKVSGITSYDAVNQVRHETAYRRWQDDAGETITRIAPLALRSYFPQELENLLHYNGFSIEERYGNWDCSPLTEESPMLLFLCSKQTKQKANNG